MQVEFYCILQCCNSFTLLYVYRCITCLITTLMFIWMSCLFYCMNMHLFIQHMVDRLTLEIWLLKRYIIITKFSVQILLLHSFASTCGIQIICYKTEEFELPGENEYGMGVDRFLHVDNGYLCLVNSMRVTFELLFIQSQIFYFLYYRNTAPRVPSFLFGKWNHPLWSNGKACRQGIYFNPY